jgi:hypothetical protein
LKVGLKDHLDRVTQAFRIAEDFVTTDEEFEVTFEYMQYLMRKHISDKIGLKYEETRKKINAARNGPAKARTHYY